MTWADIFGMVIASTGVIITILSVFVAYIMARNYMEHIREMAELNDKYRVLQLAIDRQGSSDRSMLRVSMLALKAIFDVVMQMETKEDYRSLRDRLETDRVWFGRQVPEDEAATYRARVDNEIARIEQFIKSRTTELYWMISMDNEREAHLHALVSTRGDKRTIQLLEGVRSSQSDEAEREQLLIAVSRLRQRLGQSGSAKGH